MSGAGLADQVAARLAIQELESRYALVINEGWAGIPELTASDNTWEEARKAEVCQQ